MSGYRQRFDVQTKAHDELFTEYDVRSEVLIRNELVRRTPSISIVGEEQGGEAGEDFTWYIDPIDGTINYIAGHPYFAVSIGLMLGELPILGAVVAPALNTSWHGTSGRAYRNGQQCSVSTQARLANAVIATGFPARRGARVTHRRADEFSRLLDASRELRRGGSAALDLCLVADGTYEAYWTRALAPWDVSAGAALVLGAGGRWRSVSDTRPEDLQLIASNGHIDAELDSVIFCAT
ncbi:MAG: hypothetical protein RJA70_462 [Pseudomonadota bacterium]